MCQLARSTPPTLLPTQRRLLQSARPPWCTPRATPRLLLCTARNGWLSARCDEIGHPHHRKKTRAHTHRNTPIHPRPQRDVKALCRRILFGQPAIPTSHNNTHTHKTYKCSLNFVQHMLSSFRVWRSCVCVCAWFSVCAWSRFSRSLSRSLFARVVCRHGVLRAARSHLLASCCASQRGAGARHTLHRGPRRGGVYAFLRDALGGSRGCALSPLPGTAGSSRARARCALFRMYVCQAALAAATPAAMLGRCRHSCWPPRDNTRQTRRCLRTQFREPFAFEAMRSTAHNRALHFPLLHQRTPPRSAPPLLPFPRMAARVVFCSFVGSWCFERGSCDVAPGVVRLETPTARLQ